MVEYTDRPNKNTYSQYGFFSIVCSIIGLITFFPLVMFQIGLPIGGFTYMTLFLDILLVMIIGIIAIILGAIAKKHGEKYGTYGIILGVFAILCPILFSVAILLYFG